VQERFQNAENLEVKIVSMELLTEMLEKKVKLIMLQVSLPHLSDDMIDRLHSVVLKYPGNTAIRFAVHDQVEQLRIEMPSRKMRVRPDNEFLRELEVVVPEISWKLN
jgi:DNA polymerase-3 subunit alpha